MTHRAAYRIALIVACVLVLAAVPSALAGKGGKPAGNGSTGSGGSYTATVTPAGPYHFGQAIWVTTNAPVYPNNAGPWITLTCFRDGVKVLASTHAGFEGAWYYGDPFHLGPTMSWSGGAADCTVTVLHQQNRKTVVDATTSFHVEA